MIIKYFYLFALCATSYSILAESINDGPYVFENANSRTVHWICEGKLKTEKVPYKVPTILSQCGQQVTLWEKNPAKKTQLEFNGDFAIAAASDIHGQFDLFMQLLKNNHIIDENGRWNFANGHFVITGDVFDRGPQVTEALWYLYDLSHQAKRAGGQLHLLLGNHEVMVLNADLRYLNDKYIEVAKLLDRPYESIMGKQSVLGDWLRSLSVLVKINDVLYSHGGFHPNFAKDEISLEKINQVFTDNLVESELTGSRDEFADFLHRKNGIIWYRGYFNEVEDQETSSENDIDSLLAHFKIRHLVVGHTTFDAIETRFNGKVIVIDASMKDGKYGEILLIEKNKFYRGTLAGEKTELDLGDK